MSLLVAPHCLPRRYAGRPSRRRFLRHSARAAAAFAALPWLGACQSPGGQLAGDLRPVHEAEPAQPPRPANAPLFVVVMEEMRFVPRLLSVPAGSVVRWENRSRFAHTATADPALTRDPEQVLLPEGVAPWDSGLILPGDRWARLFSVPGDYAYFCLPHADAAMTARIEVTA